MVPTAIKESFFVCTCRSSAKHLYSLLPFDWYILLESTNHDDEKHC